MVCEFVWLQRALEQGLEVDVARRLLPRRSFSILALDWFVVGIVEVRGWREVVLRGLVKDDLAGFGFV